MKGRDAAAITRFEARVGEPARIDMHTVTRTSMATRLAVMFESCNIARTSSWEVKGKILSPLNPKPQAAPRLGCPTSNRSLRAHSGGLIQVASPSPGHGVRSYRSLGSSGRALSIRILSTASKVCAGTIPSVGWRS